MTILKGKTAVVTGSTSGIGLGCARAFAGAGANIVLNGIEAPADVEKARTAIENDFGVKAIYSPANMAEPMEIASMISLTEKTFGRVDVLVNNAGIQHVSPIEDFPVEKWDAVIAINLSSAFHAIRAVTPGKRGKRLSKLHTAYDEALAEVRSFTESISGKAQAFADDRSDKWQNMRDDDGHKAAVYEFLSSWRYASENLPAIGFDAATKKHVEILDELPPKVEAKADE